MSEFIARCMIDPTMTTEYPNERQRVAICAKTWREEKE
jgi:hypothetical protein